MTLNPIKSDFIQNINDSHNEKQQKFSTEQLQKITGKITELDNKILFLLDDKHPLSNTKISKILNKHKQGISRNLKNLTKHDLVKQNQDAEYIITNKGLELTHNQTFKNPYNEESREFVHRLKSRYMFFGATALFAILGIPRTSEVSAMSVSSTSSVLVSKPILASIITAILITGGGGLIYQNAYYSDPSIEYSLYPTQLPADLHGASLQVDDVYSTDNKSRIVHYDCDNESIIRDLDYTFDCITENSLGNKETVTTIISVKGPDNLLGVDATDCISQHYVLSDDMTQDYPYLLDLPHASPTYLSNLKQDHKKLMDDYYESHDYISAKIHATIVLKYFDANEIQTISTMGNIIRDEDRSDLSGTQCAVVIHSTPHLYSTVWGKLSLAEDYHVLGNYDESIRLSSLVIDNYEKNNSNISEISYANALTIKANALYRQALDEQSGLDDAKIHYIMAHDIRKSYDTWFGLGNIDRQEERFADALDKYHQAKLLIKDTDEIDKAINSISFVSKKV